jgi:DNA-directed RNA polymerase specialized sigma24 family protein
MGGREVPVSLTEALRAGSPQAFGALYDEYAGALYAYCYVMVGDGAGDALRDAFSTVARHPDAVPGGDAELPVWLHSLVRAECVRRGALLRGVVTTTSADPLRRALAHLSPEHREVLALSNTLTPEETAQVLGVARDTTENLVWEAQRRLELAAASVGGGETPDSAMLASLSGEALHRLVTLGHEPPAGQREWVLSSFAAGGRAPVFDADGTPLPPDAFSAQAGDATDQFPRISPDEPATAPLSRIDGLSPDTPPDQTRYGEPWPAEPAFVEPGFAEAVALGLESVGWEPASAGPAEDSNTGELPPFAGGAHAKRRRPSLGRRFVPIAALVACAAAAAGVAFAWPSSHHANETGAIVHQSARPSRSVQPAPSADQDSPPPQTATSDPAPSAAPPSSAAPADGSGSATSTPSAEPTPKPKPKRTTKPKPHHPAAPGNGRPTTGHRGPGRTCYGTSGRAFRCVRPHPWHPEW